MNLFSTLQDPAATKMRQAVRLFAEALLELAAEPGAASVDAVEAVAAPSTSFAGPPPPSSTVEDHERSAPVDAQIKQRAAPIVAAAVARGKESAAKLDEVRRLAGTMPVSQLVQVVGLSQSTLYKMAQQHGFKLGQASHELKINLDELRRLAPTMDGPALAEHFGCTTPAVYLAGKNHGIEIKRGDARRQWPDERIEMLRAKAGKVEVPQLCIELGVSTASLYSKASELGLSLVVEEWPAERLAELRRLAGTMDTAELAQALQVSVAALAKQASRSGISLKMTAKRDRVPAPWEAELGSFAGVETLVQLEARFGVARSALYASAKRQGLSLSTRGRTAPAATTAETPRQVTEVSAAVDEVPSTFSNGAWIERDDVQPLTHFQLPGELVPDTLRINGLAVAVDEAGPDQSPALEGISYSITTPDRSPPSPELIEAL